MCTYDEVCVLRQHRRQTQDTSPSSRFTSRFTGDEFVPFLYGKKLRCYRSVMCDVCACFYCSYSLTHLVFYVRKLGQTVIMQTVLSVLLPRTLNFAHTGLCAVSMMNFVHRELSWLVKYPCKFSRGNSTRIRGRWEDSSKQ